MRSLTRLRLLALLAALVLAAAACTSGNDDDSADGGGDTTEATDTGGSDGGDEVDLVQGDGSLLDEVMERGTLNCGVNGTVPGFSFQDANGEFTGFDVDFCKAVAAAVLGDAEAVEYVPLDARQRFTALQSGEIDVLIRNTTYTASRDGSEGATFLFTTFYDGQGMMVPADSGITDFAGLQDAAICVLSGTTTELNLATHMAAEGIAFTPLSFANNDELRPAFEQGQCQGWTSDASQLAALKSSIEEAGGPALTILDTIISKEPLGPVVRDGDSEWAQAVNWAVMAPIQAEEFGLTQADVGSYDGDNPEIQRFLGQEADFDPGLGLPADFAVQVVSAVGNYAEIYDRNVAPLGIPAGKNALWSKGGLLYVPPYR